MATKDTAVFIYPWDLVDEGIYSVLDRLNTNHINGIQIATNYHSGMFLLPHNPQRKLYFPQPGALYFEPDSAWYGKIKIKPPVSTIASRSFWSALRGETSKRSMKLVSWTISLHGSYIGLHYPETNTCNAFGDRNPTIPCVANDDVRQFLLCLLTDLAANYSFDTILLESLECMPVRHGYHHEVIGIPLTPSIEFLLSVSFSDDMMGKAKDAGIDADRVREYVKSICLEHFKDPYGRGVRLDWDQLHQAIDGQLASYLAFRQSLLSSLLVDISKAVRKQNTKLAVIDFGPVWYPMGADGSSWESGLNMRNYFPFIDEIQPTLYFHNVRALKDKIDRYTVMARNIEPKIPVRPIIRCILPQVTSRQDLIRQVECLWPYSDGLSFYNYSFMPHPTLNWISDVLRMSAGHQ